MSPIWLSVGGQNRGVNEHGEVAAAFVGKFWELAQSRLILAPTGEKREDCAGGAMAAAALRVEMRARTSAFPRCSASPLQPSSPQKAFSRRVHRKDVTR
jgi:hypothetical protein